MKWRSSWLVTLAVLLLALPTAALAQQKTLKYAHFQPARPDQPKHAAALAFKEHVEKAAARPSLCEMVRREHGEGRR